MWEGDLCSFEVLCQVLILAEKILKFSLFEFLLLLFMYIIYLLIFWGKRSFGMEVACKEKRAEHTQVTVPPLPTLQFLYQNGLRIILGIQYASRYAGIIIQ